MPEEPEVTILPPTMALASDPRPKKASWMLLPIDTADGACMQCGVIHEPEYPHDVQKLHYQYYFYAEHDRWPTWVDAMAHCTDEMYEAWREGLAAHGVEIPPR